jgi:hypothetical protein
MVLHCSLSSEGRQRRKKFKKKRKLTTRSGGVGEWLIRGGAENQGDKQWSRIG